MHTCALCNKIIYNKIKGRRRKYCTFCRPSISQLDAKANWATRQTSAPPTK